MNIQPFKLFKSGFTLVELMISVVIIGIIAAIAVPGYSNYVVRSKLAEAYQNLGVLKTHQFSYFLDNAEFRHMGTENPELLLPSMTIQNVYSVWDGWHPVPPGGQVFFSYTMLTGQTNSSGTAVGATDPTNPMPISNPASAVTSLLRRMQSTNGVPAGRCNANVSLSSFGYTIAASNYDWGLMTAVGDLNSKVESTCTAVAWAFETRNGEPTTVGGPVFFNLGQ